MIKKINITYIPASNNDMRERKKLEMIKKMKLTYMSASNHDDNKKITTIEKINIIIHNQN
jgi:hypothetical protein